MEPARNSCMPGGWLGLPAMRTICFAAAACVGAVVCAPRTATADVDTRAPATRRLAMLRSLAECVMTSNILSGFGVMSRFTDFFASSLSQGRAVPWHNAFPCGLESPDRAATAGCDRCRGFLFRESSPTQIRSVAHRRSGARWLPTRTHEHISGRNRTPAPGLPEEPAARREQPCACHGRRQCRRQGQHRGRSTDGRSWIPSTGCIRPR